jgi:hypothetical protein
MTGNFEQPKHTGARDAWPEASTSLVQADDILTPEEVAAKLNVPDSWVYEKTRKRCRNPIPCLRLGRYVRLVGRGDMAGRPRAPRRHSDKTVSSEPPERAAPGPAKTGLILKKARRTFPRIWADRIARRTGAPVANTSARPTPKWPSLARSLNWSPLSNSRQLATWTAHLMPFLCCHGSVQPTVPQRDLLQ